MLCDKMRVLLEELQREEYPPALREHLAHCVECANHAQRWELLRAGFRELHSEPIPEPSCGFTARVMRRLTETAGTWTIGDEFLERIGRRFVYGGVLLALLLLLVLAVPATGPFRAAASTEVVWPPTELVAANGNLLLLDDSQLTPDLVPSEFMGNNGREQK